MTPIAALFAALFSVLVPTKMWFGTNQPVDFTIDGKQDTTLVLTDFTGKQLPPKGSADVAAGQKVDVRTVFPEINDSGTYVLYAVPKGKSLPDFLGTPVVLENRVSKDTDNKPTVIAAEPLQYVTMQTDAGDIKMIFYYDVAPLTVDSFLRLSAEGFFDGLTFHRIIKGFVIQGGDPRGDGTGGPGYSIAAEFNDRPHLPGVLSMARATDPNSAGSQFFICLDYSRTKSLDHKYTAFGKVVDGMAVVNMLGAVPTGAQDIPRTLQLIKKVTVKPVTPSDNPYKDYFAGK
ncbi:MAG TPA: peptidylprolyl isomerase [Humisphaera sp.]|nr:peptidylprolyl isomerase [Humisphaera sp.]